MALLQRGRRWALGLVLAVTGVEAGARPADCVDLEGCVRTLIAAALPGPGISDSEQQASRAVLAFGEAAVPPLLELLDHPSEAVRHLASYTLRDAAVREEHLDALIASRQRGDEWIPPAIARIGTPRAISFLVSELRREPQAATQLTWALRLLGAAVVPDLLGLFRCAESCDERVLLVAGQVLGEIGAPAQAAIPELLEMAEDERNISALRRAAIRALGHVADEPMVARLERLAAGQAADLDEAVARAMIDLGGVAAEKGRRAEARARERCRTPGTAEAERARHSLDSLQASIEIGDLPAATAGVRALLASRCYRAATTLAPVLEFSHPLALRDWWHAGGRRWLEAQLEPPLGGSAGSLRERVVFPPTPRRVLLLETSARDALAPLLCPAADDTCGRETAGWVERARQAFAAHAALQPQPLDLEPTPSPARCEDDLRAEGSLGWTTWTECVASRRRWEWALPLGRFRAPDRGWLVVTGRRGHYDFCDGLAAFDLATGAAWIARSCSALQLLPGGGVDFEATERSRRPAVEARRVNVSNLREAAWMMLLAAEAEQALLTAEYVPLPAGLEPEGAEESASFVQGGGWWGSTDQTTLGWDWLTPAGQALAAGTLTWPHSAATPEAHAAALLRITELGMEPSCPPSAPPPLAPGAPGVHPLDGRPADTDRNLSLLAVAHRNAAAAACDKPMIER